MKYLNNKIRLYRKKAGLLRGAYEHNVQRLWNTVPDLYRKIADIKVVLVVTQCVPGDQLDTASSVKLNTSRSWCLYSPLCHQKCWSFCANHLVHIIWQNSRLLVCVYNGYGGGPQNGWIVGAVQSTVIRLKSGMLVKTRIQAGFSITFAVTFRHIGVVWEDDTRSMPEWSKPKSYWRKSDTDNCTKHECKHHFLSNFKKSELCCKIKYPVFKGYWCVTIIMLTL